MRLLIASMPPSRSEISASRLDNKLFSAIRFWINDHRMLIGTKYARPMVNRTDREMAILTIWARLQIVGIVKIARNMNGES